jgi:hypothetical protein
VSLIQPAIQVTVDRDDPLESADPLGAVTLSSPNGRVHLETVWLDDCLETLVEGVLRLEHETDVVVKHNDEPLHWVLVREGMQVHIGAKRLNIQGPTPMVSVGRLADFKRQLRAVAQAIVGLFDESCGPSAAEAFPVLRAFTSTDTAR